MPRIAFPLALYRFVSLELFLIATILSREHVQHSDRDECPQTPASSIQLDSEKTKAQRQQTNLQLVDQETRRWRRSSSSCSPPRTAPPATSAPQWAVYQRTHRVSYNRYESAPTESKHNTPERTLTRSLSTSLSWQLSSSRVTLGSITSPRGRRRCLHSSASPNKSAFPIPFSLLVLPIV